VFVPHAVASHPHVGPLDCAQVKKSLLLSRFWPFGIRAADAAALAIMRAAGIVMAAVSTVVMIVGLGLSPELGAFGAPALVAVGGVGIGLGVSFAKLAMGA
jgi:hypothetical protein